MPMLIRVTFVMLVSLAAMLASVGCAGGGTNAPPDPDGELARRIVAAGGLLALDIDAITQDGATDEERANLERSAARALELVGVDSATGQELARLIAVLAATGNVEEDSWRVVVRALLEWASEPTPPNAMNFPTSPGMLAAPEVFSTRHGLRIQRGPAWLYPASARVLATGAAIRTHWNGAPCNSPETPGCRDGWSSWSIPPGTSITAADAQRVILWNGAGFTWGGPVDIDLDGDAGTDADIEAFYRALATGQGSADFDADEDVGTDADIQAFYLALGGG